MTKFERLSDTVVKVNSESGSTYYITEFGCPTCKDVLRMCTCPHFLMGIPRMGGNPFQTPCKHIRQWREK